MHGQNTETPCAAQVYEFAFEPVPKGHKKTTSSIFIVLAGYVTALSCLATGAKIGGLMTFQNAVWACFTGNAVLFCMAVLLGIVACETGWSTTFLSRQVFGKTTSRLFSFLIILSSVIWIGLNGDLFSRMIARSFTWWPLPTALTAVLVIGIWTQSAMRGWKGIELVSWIAVPIAVSIIGVCAYDIWTTVGFVTITTYKPLQPLSFTAASSAIVGNFVFGCTITPDVCRFARSRKAVLIAVFFALLIGLFGLNVCGVLIAQTAGNTDFNHAVATLGLSLPVFLCAVFCLWPTQDNNIYGGSLAIQNILQGTQLEGFVSHRFLACILACLSAIFAAIGAAHYLLPIIIMLSVLLPPVSGMLFAEYFFVKRSREKQTGNWIA
ncbi:MAG: cytosine permease, partial [Bilophila sp.]